MKQDDLFEGGSAKKSGASRKHYQRRDHGRPPLRARWEGADGKEIAVWIYCEKCMAEKAGHYDNGAPRFSGGHIRIQYRNARGAKRLIGAACDCEHGEKWKGKLHPYRMFREGMELREDLHGIAGEVTAILIPGRSPGVEISRIGGKSW